MAKTIHKYPLQITDTQTVELPRGARVLSVQFQHAALCCWALVDPAALKEPREFLICGTGHPIDFTVVPEGAKSFGGAYGYISTVQQNGGKLVWPVFIKDAP